jgi:hypothetical protein
LKTLSIALKTIGQTRIRPAWYFARSGLGNRAIRQNDLAAARGQYIEMLPTHQRFQSGNDLLIGYQVATLWPKPDIPELGIIYEHIGCPWSIGTVF